MKQLLLTVAVLLCSVATLLAQRTITGTIQDIDNTPLIGASVLVAGTTSGTVTDFDGKFSLATPEGSDKLVISYTGYASQEVMLDGRTDYDITMQEGVQLSDVVVTALGISRDEKSLGYGVDQIDGEALNAAKESSLVNALTGRIAGAQINNNNAGLGGSSSIILRGATSVSGNNQPLFVVDGTPIANDNNNGANAAEAFGGRDYGNTAQDINPNDIASVSILKGGAAAALYGSRASNGVILITTKSGANRKGIGVTINSGVTMQQVALLPDYQNDYGGGYSLEFGEFSYDPAIHPDSWEAFDGQPLPEYYADESWGPELDGRPVRHWDSWYPGETFGELRPWSANPDNIKNFYDTGVTFTNNVAIAGGNDLSTFRLSYTNSAQKGVFPESRLDRNTVAVSATQKLGSKLTAGINANYVNTRGEGRPAIGYGGFGDAVNVQTNFNEWYQRQLDTDRLRNYEQADGTPRTWNINGPTDLSALYWESPFWVVNKDRGQDQRDRVYGNISLRYDVLPGLAISGFLRTDYYQFGVQDRLASRSTANIPYFESFDVTSRENNYELLADYNTSLSDDFTLDAQLGTNLRKQTFNSSRSKTSGGLSVPDLYNINASIDRPERTDFRSEREIQSVYGRIGFGWRSMLYVDATARNDWSSTLEDGQNSYFYPSVSTSFVFSELIGDNNVLSYGKIRAGFATVGNDTEPYSTRNVFTPGDPYGSNPAFALPNTQPKFDLSSESITTWEAGLEFRLLDDRIGLDVTYYDIESTDLIINLPVSSATGFTTANTNAGLVTNKGIEVKLYATPIKTPNFTWNTAVNFARNRNEVVELAEGQDRLVLGAYGTAQLVAQVGKPYGTFIASGYSRNDAGEILVNEAGFPILESNLEFGSAYPDFTGGFINDFEIFGFNVGTVFDFRKGGTIYSISNRWGTYSGQFDNTVGNNELGNPVRNPVTGDANSGGVLIDGVKPDGSDNDTYVDAQTHFGRLRNFNEAFLFDASFIKFRELSIGRNLPAAWFANNFISTARVSLVGRNLAILHKNTPNIDPEQALTNGNVQGFENGQSPTVRSFGINLNLGF